MATADGRYTGAGPKFQIGLSVGQRSDRQAGKQTSHRPAQEGVLRCFIIGRFQGLSDKTVEYLPL